LVIVFAGTGFVFVEEKAEETKSRAICGFNPAISISVNGGSKV
jgi:hypothetical protein